MKNNIEAMLTILDGARKLRVYYQIELITINPRDRLTIAMYFREIERNTLTINETIIKLLVEVLDESKEFGQAKIRAAMASYQGKCFPHKG